MNRFWIPVVMALLLLPVDSGANIYKCVSKDGVVKFSDQPCSADAQIAFDTKHQKFDYVVGNARIYPAPVPASQFHVDDITEHAKKVGRSIIAGEINNSAFYNGSGGSSSRWYIQLYFGPIQKKKKYWLRMAYLGKSDYKGMQVWLESFSVKKDGQPYDPPSMSNSEKFTHAGTGRWIIKQK